VKFPDHFSGVASDYAAFRPRYPAALFDWLASICQRHEVAWDCACGSGQASRPLASHFDLVVGTDASPTQVAAAEATENIRLVVAASETVPVAEGVFDLVTVAQALHWFVGEAFYAEVRRVVRPGGVFAAWTYGMPHIVTDRIEKVVHGFINGLLWPYWPPEVRMVLDGYASIELPFEELKTPPFEMRLEWTLERFLGFVRTWSAVGRLLETTGVDPVHRLAEELEGLWGSEEDLLPVSYRLDLRVGRV
jgi:SAM-dependent methyltransferase